MHDVVVIGGGHNGLVCAALLAGKGRRPLVLERADRVGGAAQMSEIASGFRCPTLAHRAAIDPALVRAFALERRGLHIVRPPALVTSPAADGRALTIWADPAGASREIASFSEHDARRYPQFQASVAAVTGVLRTVL